MHLHEGQAGRSSRLRCSYDALYLQNSNKKKYSVGLVSQVWILATQED